MNLDCSLHLSTHGYNPRVIYSDWPQSEKDRLIAATAHIEENWLAWTKEKGLPGKLMLEEMNALLKEWRGE